ncbi:MAG: flavodoxin-dependent (E)-4-hydroxy-3-methylbut-2-enyl-diphosphate synthase, partial [Pseudomonadota bacterium]
CCVNGPGEARAAQVGLAGGSPSLIYIDGKPDHKVTNEQLVDELERVIRARLDRPPVEAAEAPPAATPSPVSRTG